MTSPRFTQDEIEGFLRFLLEGGADKRCSNVYLIITQLRDDLAEAKKRVDDLEDRIQDAAYERAYYDRD